MNIEYIEGHLDGSRWEELCDACYRIRYQKEHYQKVPANQGGDGGIEGFTKTGIVYQCYCPEKQYSDDDLYEHLRNKMTKDINKLVAPAYAKRLKEFGISNIREWHFVIPNYRDHRIIQHAASKTQEVLSTKRANPHQYDYIDDNFSIIIKVANDFAPELSKVILNDLSDVKLNLSAYAKNHLDWSKCSSDKVENIRRKVKAVMDCDEEDEDYKEMVQLFIESYIKGINILADLRESYSEIYEEIYQLEQSYKNDVKMKTKLNTNSSMNYSLFNEIMNEFEQQLTLSFSKCLNKQSILELKSDLISSWLADCSMEFKSR